jgi:hypothetical protein
MKLSEAQRRALPRFMSDEQLREYFGLSERALTRLRATSHFPARDGLINKTDRRAVELFFDRRAGIAFPVAANGNLAVVDGEENFDD